jgi:hypothetical protein
MHSKGIHEDSAHRTIAISSWLVEGGDPPLGETKEDSVRKRALGALMVVAFCVAAMPALANTHDLQVTVTTNGTTNTFAKPGTLKVTVKIKNNGPQAVVYEDGGYTFGVSKFDHTGQQFLKEIGKRDVPLLSAPGGSLQEFTYTFEEAEPPTGKFFYRAFIGKKAGGVYSDSNNINNKAEAFLTIGDRISWRTRLLPDHFTKAEVTLTTTELQKLNQTAYSLADMVSSNTDRLVDGSKCSSCHTGQATQSITKYRPDLSSLPVPSTRNHRPTKTSEITTGYNWANADTSQSIAMKFKVNTAKDEKLRRIFYYWYVLGARENP